MRLVGEHILICISDLPHKNPSPALQTLLGFVAPALPCFPWKGDVCPPQANSQAAVVWRAREIKEPPTDPTYCLPLSPSISSMPQSASYTCTSRLPGLWQSPALHLFAYAWAGHVWIQRADREARKKGREGRREGSHRQALFIRLLGGAKAQRCWGGRGGVGRAHQCVIRLGTLTDVDSWSWHMKGIWCFFYLFYFLALMQKDYLLWGWWGNLYFSWMEPYLALLPAFILFSISKDDRIHPDISWEI